MTDSLCRKRKLAYWFIPCVFKLERTWTELVPGRFVPLKLMGNIVMSMPIRVVVGEWRHGLFNCFDDLGICIIAYIVPCVTFGQNAEAIGEGSCFLCGLAYLVPILNIIEWLNIRGKVRESSGIDGSTLGDCCTILFCPLCALVQEAQEIKDSPNFSPILRT